LGPSDRAEGSAAGGRSRGGSAALYRWVGRSNRSLDQILLGGIASVLFLKESTASSRLLSGHGSSANGLLAARPASGISDAGPCQVKRHRNGERRERCRRFRKLSSSGVLSSPRRRGWVLLSRPSTATHLLIYLLSLGVAGTLTGVRVPRFFFLAASAIDRGCAWHVTGADSVSRVVESPQGQSPHCLSTSLTKIKRVPNGKTGKREFLVIAPRIFAVVSGSQGLRNPSPVRLRATVLGGGLWAHAPPHRW